MSVNSKYDTYSLRARTLSLIFNYNWDLSLLFRQGSSAPPPASIVPLNATLLWWRRNLNIINRDYRLTTKSNTSILLFSRLCISFRYEYFLFRGKDLHRNVLSFVEIIKMRSYPADLVFLSDRLMMTVLYSVKGGRLPFFESMIRIMPSDRGQLWWRY